MDTIFIHTSHIITCEYVENHFVTPIILINLFDFYSFYNTRYYRYLSFSSTYVLYCYSKKRKPMSSSN